MMNVAMTNVVAPNCLKLIDLLTWNEKSLVDNLHVRFHCPILQSNAI